MSPHVRSVAIGAGCFAGAAADGRYGDAACARTVAAGAGGVTAGSVTRPHLLPGHVPGRGAQDADPAGSGVRTRRRA